VVGKPEREPPFGRPRRRLFEVNIKMDLKKVCGLGSCGSVQGKVAGTCKHGIELSISIKCGEILDYLRNCQLFNDPAAYRCTFLCLLPMKWGYRE
jgi:hypothetical protein